MDQKRKKRVIQVASFGLLALSALAVSASNAMAWGPWGSWATTGNVATCSGTAGSGTTLNCTGSAAVYNNQLRTLYAFTPSTTCGQKTHANGWPKKADNTFVAVIANATGSAGSSTASTSSPHNLTHSICQCRYDIC
jgi:hypothetical protein